MILSNPKTTTYLKDPAELINFSGPELMRLRFLAEDNNIIFKIPEHLKNNKDKRIYKVGFLNEYYSYLFQNKKKNEIYDHITDKYQIFLELRQYQIDVKQFKDEKYTKFVLCI